MSHRCAVRSVQERAYLMIRTHGGVAIQRQSQERPFAGFSSRGLPQHTTAVVSRLIRVESTHGVA
eukprot:4818688-Prymnesium_polylepis.1